MTITRSQAIELLKANNLAPRRAFGQNFVVDPNTVRRIARIADVDRSSHVVEVGAGLGSLTLALAETGAQVLALEIDDGLVKVLRQRGGARQRAGRPRRRDQDRPQPRARPRPALVPGRQPAVQHRDALVMNVLDQVPIVERMLVMVQKWPSGSSPGRAPRPTARSRSR
ncbi:MAG: rRNA adenine N-6-methyltransferase family protein [Ilumatobacteraceae bacterium]